MLYSYLTKFTQKQALTCEEHCRFLLIFVLLFDLCNSPLKEVLRTNTDSAAS